jgi:5-methylcytosine-specific restriction endonuclease McrA
MGADIACPACGMRIDVGELERHKIRCHSAPGLGTLRSVSNDTPNSMCCPDCDMLILVESLPGHLATFHAELLRERLARFSESSPRESSPATGSTEPLRGEQRTRVPIPKAVKAEVWKRDGGRCRNCGITDYEAVLRDGEHLQYDHIRPWSLNGADTVNNIQLLCGQCNRAKAARLPGETRLTALGGELYLLTVPRALAPIARSAEELNVVHRVRAAARPRNLVIVVKIDGRPALGAPAAVPHRYGDFHVLRDRAGMAFARGSGGRRYYRSRRLAGIHWPSIPRRPGRREYPPVDRISPGPRFPGLGSHPQGILDQESHAGAQRLIRARVLIGHAPSVPADLALLPG